MCTNSEPRRPTLMAAGQLRGHGEPSNCSHMNCSHVHSSPSMGDAEIGGGLPPNQAVCSSGSRARVLIPIKGHRIDPRYDTTVTTCGECSDAHVLPGSVRCRCIATSTTSFLYHISPDRIPNSSAFGRLLAEFGSQGLTQLGFQLDLGFFLVS